MEATPCQKWKGSTVLQGPKPKGSLVPPKNKAQAPKEREWAKLLPYHKAYASSEEILDSLHLLPAWVSFFLWLIVHLTLKHHTKTNQQNPQYSLQVNISTCLQNIIHNTITEKDHQWARAAQKCSDIFREVGKTSLTHSTSPFPSLLFSTQVINCSLWVIRAFRQCAFFDLDSRLTLK